MLPIVMDIWYNEHDEMMPTADVGGYMGSMLCKLLHVVFDNSHQFYVNPETVLKKICYQKMSFVSVPWLVMAQRKYRYYLHSGGKLFSITRYKSDSQRCVVGTNRHYLTAFTEVPLNFSTEMHKKL